MTRREQAIAAALLDGSLRLASGDRLDELPGWDATEHVYTLDDSTDVPPDVRPGDPVPDAEAESEVDTCRGSRAPLAPGGPRPAAAPRKEPSYAASRRGGALR
jgi:hypothetical protein